MVSLEWLVVKMDLVLYMQTGHHRNSRTDMVIEIRGCKSLREKDRSMVPEERELSGSHMCIIHSFLWGRHILIVLDEHKDRKLDLC